MLALAKGRAPIESDGRESGDFEVPEEIHANQEGRIFEGRVLLAGPLARLLVASLAKI
jgi:hypothetical protein